VTEIPSLSYRKVVNALQRAGFVVIRQKGSHIRLIKRTLDEMLKITVPAYLPIKRTTLRKIIKDAKLSVKDFKKLL
jgi:predicted RNA binding protein YcfA (HicA-like mRNA interferase family)